MAAVFDGEPAEYLEPPDAALEELLASPSDSDELFDPPEPADFELAAASPAARLTPKAAPRVAPKLRPATELQQMNPSPNFPEGGYALRPWTDALAVAGPDRSSLFSPTKSLEMRKSSLNGTASARFDPLPFRASERIAQVPFPISEPENSTVSIDRHDYPLTPCTAFAWPAPLHAALIAAEMRLNGTSNGVPVGESFFAVKQPALSAEFLSRVALQSRVLEPRRSAILSPPERDGFTSAAADEEESVGKYASATRRSDRDETDGGERAHVADLF
jgi:hypothetical protein